MVGGQKVIGPDAGWSLPLERAYDNQHLQNELDAESIYNILQFDIIPKYFDKDEEGISQTWVAFIKNIIAEVAPYFTMKRMLDHYYERFYNKLFERGQKVKANSFKQAKQLAAWKADIEQKWEGVEIASSEVYDTDNQSSTSRPGFYCQAVFKPQWYSRQSYRN